MLPQGSAASNGNAGIKLRKTVDSASLTPVLALTLNVDKSQAIPGDTLTYSGTVSNTGGVLGLTGGFVASAHADADATVVYYWDELQTCLIGCGAGLGDPHWTALVAFVASRPNYQPVTPPAVSSGMSLTATPMPASDVTYPQTGDPILGTNIGPTATAGWTYQATSPLTPAQTAILTDPNQVQHLRNVIHFEVQPRNSQAAQPFDDAPEFVNPLQAQANAAAATNVVITITLPSGRPVQLTSGTIPALASLAPGASANYATTYRVPTATSRGSSETEPAYLLRLTGLEGSSLTASASVTANGSTGPVSATAPPVTSTEHVPIVTIGKSGPTTVTAGTTATYSLALQNVGGAPASGIAIADTVPSGTTGTVSGIPITLAPLASSTGVQATFAVPASQSSGNLTDTATVNWLDANGNPYGSLSSAFTTLVQNTLQGAKFTLALSSGSAGLNPVNGSQSVQISLITGGGSPIPGQAVTVNVTGANPTTLTATTDTNGQATVSYSGVTPGLDQLQATASSSSITIHSNTVSVTWIATIEPISTTPAQGVFYAEGAAAQTFVAKPGDTAAFQQTFPTVNFNPPANTVPHNVSGVGPTTTPFTDVTTDAVGNFAGTIVAQGSGLQAGVGTLTSFDAVLTANFVVAQPQDVTFQIVADDGFVLGVGGGASRVAGTLQNPPASGLTAFSGYQVLGAYNTGGATAPLTHSVTIHFPSAGAYPYELDYFECCGSQLSLTMTVVSVNTGPYNLSTGYADSVRPAGTSSFPFPWNGAPNTTFVGSGSPYDTGGLRFDNNSNQPITLNHVTVDIGTHHYDPWNLDQTIPANGTLILANPTGSVFDTSEAGGTGTSAGSGGGSGGFVAAPFATGFNTMGTLGPIGVAFDNGGNLFVMNYATGILYKFGPGGGVAGPATQVSATGIFGCQTSVSASSGLAFSKDGKHLYLAQQCSGQVLEVDQTTGVVIRTVASGIPYATGIATDPVSGDLFVTEPSFGHDDVIRVSNPTSANPTVAPFAHPGSKSDGIAFGPDGTLYVSVCCSAVEVIAGTSASVPGTILAYIANPALAGNDGIALLPPPAGAVGESIVVNSNNGFIVEIDNPLTATPTFHNIVTGGSRGDFVTVGPDHCLYATQSDSVEKVTSTDGSCPFVPSICITSPTVPQVHVAINGVTFDYNDSALALTGGGSDGECTGNNESQAWQQIGGKGGPVNIPLPPAMTLALQAAPSSGHIVGQSQAFTVAAMDGAGHAVPNAAVQLGVFGVNPQQLSGTTDANGTATFSYTGLNAGTDTVTATAFISGLRTVSNAVPIQWTIPAPGGPTGSTTGLAPPSVVVTAPADGSAVSQPVAITATIRAPPSSPISSWNVLYQNVSGGSFVTLASGTGNPPAPLATFDPTGLTAGTYAITVNATTAAGGIASAIVRVIVAGGGGSTAQTPPTISAPSPADGTIVTKPVPIAAVITPPAGQTIASWSVSYQSQSQGTVVPILSGTGSPPTPLATFDPTLLPNDTYAIIVSATASGGGTQTVTSTVAVAGNLKLGRYITTYQDLSAPVSGFTMQVKRVYDSTDKRVGDFGVGWHLDVANFRVSANRQLGAGGWTEFPTECIFGLCFYGFKTSVSHFVTVTFPDQHLETFDFAPQGGAGLLYFQGSAAFTARPGTTSTLGVSGDASLTYGFDGNLYGSSGFYNPTRFKLTTRSGLVLTIDTVLGLVSETNLNGNSLAIDASGIHSTIGPATSPTAGPSITFNRDASYRVASITGPSQQNLTYAYSATGDLDSSTDANGNLTTYTYDFNHNLLKTIGAGQPVSTLTYDPSGRLTSITDGAGNTTQISDNVAGQTETVIDPAGKLTTVLSLDDLGDIVRTDRSAGGQTLTRTSTFDAFGRPLTAVDPLRNKRSLVYDAQGNPTQYTDENHNVTNLTYNAFGEVTGVVRADGLTGSSTTVTYDSQGNALVVQHADGSATTFSYDAAGRAVSVSQGPNRAYLIAYDTNGHASQVTDPSGRTMQVQNDASGRLASITDPLGAKTTFTYDGVGNLTEVKDAAGHLRGFTYDGLNRVTMQTDALGNKQTSQYDAAGNLAQVVDRNGQTTTYSYDLDGQLLRTAFSDGDFLALTYDGFGRGTGASNSTSTITSSFDANSRLVSQTTTGPSPLGSVTTTYGYDGIGNRTSMSGPDGQTLYGFDSRSRLTSITDPSGGPFTFGYDAGSRLASISRPNGVTDSLTYNQQGGLTSQTSTVGATTIAQLTQTYDPTAHITSRTDATGTTTYVHDAAGQLTSVTAPGQSPQTYAYDALGNRTAGPASPAGTLIYDANNRLLSDATYTYSYSSQGDRTARTNKATGAVSTYVYNSRHQLMSVVNPDASTTTFKYDPFGRGVQVATAAQTTSYVYDGANIHLEYGGSGLAAAYTDQVGTDQPLEMVRGGVPYYFHQDGLGSVTRLTDRNGGTAATYTYDPYGIAGPGTGSVANPFTFTGREFDASSGLYSYRARYYDPGTGTFLSEDPIQAVNAYSYVRNDPADYVDPSGTDIPGLTFLIAKIREFATYTRFVGCEWGFIGATMQNVFDTVVIHQPPSPTTMVENLAVGCMIGYVFPGVAPGAGGAQKLWDVIAGGVFAPFFVAFLSDLWQQRSCGKTDLVHAFYAGVQAAEIAFAAKELGFLPAGNVLGTAFSAPLSAVSDQTPGVCH